MVEMRKVVKMIVRIILGGCLLPGKNNKLGGLLSFGEGEN